MNKILAAIEVLHQGKELANKEVWKNAQTVVGILTALLPALAVVSGISLSPEDAGALAAGVGVLVGLFNSYVTVGTSTTVGLRAGAEDAAPPTDRDTDAGKLGV